jgi:hypothetical protein
LNFTVLVGFNLCHCAYTDILVSEINTVCYSWLSAILLCISIAPDRCFPLKKNFPVGNKVAGWVLSYASLIGQNTGSGEMKRLVRVFAL